MSRQSTLSDSEFLATLRGEEDPYSPATLVADARFLATLEGRSLSAPIRRIKDSTFLAVVRGEMPCPKRKRRLTEGRRRLSRRTLTESCDCSAVTADESTIRNVKILGTESKNGRRYLPDAISEAVGMYEGAKVNIDHPEGSPNASRSLKDRVGKLINVRMEGDSLRGDLEFNPHTSLGRAITWFAEHQPDCLGLSHNAVGQGETVDGVFVVERIAAVRSVDLVADPATTSGLFD